MKNGRYLAHKANFFLHADCNCNSHNKTGAAGMYYYDILFLNSENSNKMLIMPNRFTI